MMMYKGLLYVYFSTHYTTTPNGTTTTKYNGFTSYLKMQNNTLVKNGISENSVSSFRKFSDGTFLNLWDYNWVYGTHAGPVNTGYSYIGMKIDFNGVVFANGNIGKSFYLQYPYFENFTPLEISFKYLVFNNSLGKVMFFSGEQSKLTNYGIGFKSNEIRNLKLIESPKYSIFHKEIDTLSIYDNSNQTTINKFYLPEGELTYDKERRTMYSHNQLNIFRITKIMKMIGFADLWTNKIKYIIGDSVKIFTTIPSNVSDVSIEIDGNKYSPQSIITLKSNKIGYFSVKLNYTENGIKQTILKDSLFQVKDSLKINYKITNTYNNNVNYPFYCEASSNDPETVFTWGYAWSELNIVVDGRDARPVTKYYDNFKKGSQAVMSITHDVNLNTLPFSLKASNGTQTIIQKIDLIVNPNLAIKFNKYTGKVPFTFKAVFEKTSLLHYTEYYGRYSMNFGNKQLSIGNIIKIDKAGNATDTITQTINKPGKYKIILKYSNGYEVTHDSVITVLDNTIYQAFPNKLKNAYSNNRYAMTQDAEGFYCEFEDGGEVQLFDSMGRLLKTYQIENSEYIRKEDLQQGVYFLQINVNGEIYHEKILVE